MSNHCFWATRGGGEDFLPRKYGSLYVSYINSVRGGNIRPLVEAGGETLGPWVGGEGALFTSIGSLYFFFKSSLSVLIFQKYLFLWLLGISVV